MDRSRTKIRLTAKKLIFLIHLNISKEVFGPGSNNPDKEKKF
jgi:hypothetical protein